MEGLPKQSAGELAVLSSDHRPLPVLLSPQTSPQVHTFFDCGAQCLKTQSVADKAFKIRVQILSYDWIKNQGDFNVVLIVLRVLPE